MRENGVLLRSLAQALPVVDIGLMANKVNGEVIVVYERAYCVIIADKVVEEDQLCGGVPCKHM
jgi:hypothetical protein